VTDAPLTIKLGGSIGEPGPALGGLIARAPATTVLVHGGGNEIASWSSRLGIDPVFRDGLRVTDEPTLDVAVAVLAGLVSTRLVGALTAAGRSTAGVTGADGRLLRLARRDTTYGFVGEVVEADVSLLDLLLAGGILPVVSPIGADTDGTLLNVNADEAAGAIAAARGGRLLLCTDVPGVRRDGATVDTLSVAEAEAMLADGSASEGMRPKLRAAGAAARAGCEVLIVDGRDAESVRRAIDEGIAGTRVVGV
jgi:acetylglutamate kinase